MIQLEHVRPFIDSSQSTESKSDACANESNAAMCLIYIFLDTQLTADILQI